MAKFKVMSKRKDLKPQYVSGSSKSEVMIRALQLKEFTGLSSEDLLIVALTKQKPVKPYKITTKGLY